MSTLKDIVVLREIHIDVDKDGILLQARDQTVRQCTLYKEGL